LALNSSKLYAFAEFYFFYFVDWEFVWTKKLVDYKIIPFYSVPASKDAEIHQYGKTYAIHCGKPPWINDHRYHNTSKYHQYYQPPIYL